ncbi:MAG: NAD-dependent protein deacylase [Clostridia bacterium]|nr:NAD-dependent protein deacylase [Clostridia bacterium]
MADGGSLDADFKGVVPDNADKIAEMIKASSRIVFFGGAGVSTESGVKDYRSEDGLYNTVKEYGVSPETILSHSFFFRHTETFYDFYRKYFIGGNVKPNKAHYALAKLEEAGKLSCVVTQNIDGLHQLAGSKTVYELHGTTSKYFCTDCYSKFSVDDVFGDGKNSQGVPRCEKCGGLIKPCVTLYEESLDWDVTERAVDAIEKADMLIIGGTSLTVYPASSYVRYYKGNRLVLINRQETSYDADAAVVSRDKVGLVLDAAVKLAGIV